MFKKVLVANRGEIAVRVIRTLHEMGIPSVAVFSDADREAQHVRLAEEAFRLGPPPSTESYLRIDRILEAARKTGAEAIHPGYGFLAENPEFAKACEEEGITFLGPPSQVMAALGDKLEARKIALKAGAPVIPGSKEVPLEPGPAMKEAKKVGFPLIIKAAGGGGGKGMRVVRDEADLLSSLDLARSEAQGAFNNPTVYMERYLERPRHVEMQMLADARGEVVWLGERDCSIQRRHQKLIEESPSPAVDPELRERMGEAALKIMREAGYVGAGTVEFLLDEDGSFYFLEVNARLQVEHPVTEWITGLDLVREQIRIGAGEPLGMEQDKIRRRGWAIEARVCAEDPEADFMPSSGLITGMRLPNGPFLRCDFGPLAGDEVPVYYDSLMGKIIAWGWTREEARRRLLRGLQEFRVAGIVSNTPFLAWAVDSPAFREGKFDTGFIGKHFKPEVLTAGEDLKTLAALIAAYKAFEDRKKVREPKDTGGGSLWRLGVRRWR